MIGFDLNDARLGTGRRALFNVKLLHSDPCSDPTSWCVIGITMQILVSICMLSQGKTYYSERP